MSDAPALARYQQSTAYLTRKLTSVIWFGAMRVCVTTQRVTRTDSRGMRSRICTPARKSSRLAARFISSRVRSISFASASRAAGSSRRRLPPAAAGGGDRGGDRGSVTGPVAVAVAVPVPVGGVVNTVTVARRMDGQRKLLGDALPLVAVDELLDVAVHAHAVLPADGAHPLEAGLAEAGI